MVAVRRGLAWNGKIGPVLLAHLAGKTSSSLSAGAVVDPIGWAMQVLGFSVLGERPDRPSIQRGYREALLTAHPDRGGDSDGAAGRIADIAEARRILLAR